MHVVNVANNGTLPFLADDAVIEVSARVGRERRACRCRSRPVEPAVRRPDRRTWPPTRSWPWTRPSTVVASRVFRRAARPPAGRSGRARRTQLTDGLLAHNRELPRGVRALTRCGPACSRSTAATARPTCAARRTRRRPCSAARAVAAFRRTSSAPGAAVTGLEPLLDEVARAAGRATGRTESRTVRPASPTPTCPSSSSDLERRIERARLGPYDVRRQRHVRAAAGRHRRAAGRRGRLRRRASTASGVLPTVGPPGSPPSGTISGDWGGGGFLGRRPCGGRRGPRTGAARRRRWPASCRPLRARTWQRCSRPSTSASISESRLHEAAPLLFEAADGGDHVAISSRPAAGGRDRGARRLGAPSARPAGRTRRRDPRRRRAHRRARPPPGRDRRRLAGRAPKAVARVVTAPPVVGAALLGLDRIGASDRAAANLRATYAAG